MKGRDGIELIPEAVSGALSVGDSVTMLANSSNSNSAQQIMGAVGAVGESIKPFVPLIAAVTVVISECIKIYEDAQYNKKICNSLMDRVETADLAIRTLKRRKQENESKFRDKE